MRFFSPDIYSLRIDFSHSTKQSKAKTVTGCQSISFKYFLEKMESFDFVNVKSEKAKALRRYNRLRSFANIVRVLEVCVALFLLSLSSTHLPVVVRISGKYLHEMSILLLSTPSIFVIGNVIIITLFAQSVMFPGQKTDGNNAGDDIYDEYVRNRQSQPRIVADVHFPTPEDNTYEDKQIVSSENAVPSAHEEPVTTITTVTKVPEKVPETKAYRRTQSGTSQRHIRVESQKKLRRSETEKFQNSKSSGEEPASLLYSVDNLSNEEFQRKIEAFIEKQQRLLRQEYMAVILTDQN